MGLSADRPRADRTVALLRLGLIAVAAGFGLLFAYVAWTRLRYPYELDQLEGAIADHIERVRMGQPLYGAPTAHWIALSLPPLYYWLGWLCAAFVRSGVHFAMGRGVSLLATAAQVACIARFARNGGATRFFAAVGVGLFFACYGFVDGAFDAQRPEPLAVALSMLGFSCIAGQRTLPKSALGGLLLGAAALTQSPALLMGLAAVFVLARDGQRPHVLAASIGAIGIPLGASIVMQVGSSGWFLFYLAAVPWRQGLSAGRAWQFFVKDISVGFVLTAGTLAYLRGLQVSRESGEHALGAALAAGLVAAALCRMHEPALGPALLWWVPWACVAVAVVASRVERAVEKSPLSAVVSSVLLGTLILQMAAISYDPTGALTPSESRFVSRQWRFLPRAEHAQAAKELRELVQKLEDKGQNVWIPSRGHISAKAHISAVALAGAARALGRTPESLALALSQRQFGAVIVDRAEDPFGLAAKVPIGASYAVVRQLDDRAPPLPGDLAPAPAFVLRPRRDALGESAEEIARRIQVERALAHLAMRARQAGVQAAEVLDVESVAAELLKGPIP